jgi:hypothetical protein
MQNHLWKTKFEPTDRRDSEEVAFASEGRAVSVRDEDGTIGGPRLSFKIKNKHKKPMRGFNIHGGRKSNSQEDNTQQMKCGQTLRANSASNAEDVCPSDCPFFAQNLEDNQQCTFLCVAKEGCKQHNPNRPIADEELMTQYGDYRKICRSPMVQHCEKYKLDGTDSCEVCQRFYRLTANGKCEFRHMAVLWGLLVVLVVLTVVLVVWLVDLACRPGTNQAGLNVGLSFRSFSRLLMPKVEGQHERELWPLSTNLLREDVGGPGMVLHFNFQAVVILWALLVALTWYLLTIFVDSDLAVLGTRKFGTPRENCILVAWGYETQQRLMWTKIGFLCFVYALTFGGALLHGVRQLRIFQELDAGETTMKDFVAQCRGLPKFPGSRRLEEQLQGSLAEGTGQKVVGVSICWDFREQQELVATAIDQELDRVEASQQRGELKGAVQAADASLSEASKGVFRKRAFSLEQWVFDTDNEDELSKERLKELLGSIENTECAFVVFHSETARNAAVKKVMEMGGLKFEGGLLTLELVGSEPDTVLWQNYGTDQALLSQVRRMFSGSCLIFLGLLFWAVVFYCPYAYSVFTWNYDNGQQPGFLYGFAFSMVVVIGNAIMYAICGMVSDGMNFVTRDDRETCYMVLYTIACFFNILLDLVTTYFTAYYIMAGLNFRTYQGTKLADLPAFVDIFESYAVQRSLAESLYAYAWPATFLIPFLIEPVATIIAPLQLMKLIVRSHPEIKGRNAEMCLVATDMDMGRYGDLLLNVMLGVLIFYFPGGYTHSLFLFMALSHLFIYAFDHYRVLRTVPRCTYASTKIDWWSQVLLAPVCGFILACLLFKCNCQHYGYCLQGMSLIMAWAGAFFLHVVVHILLLIYFVPMLAKPKEESDDGLTFADYHR